MKELIERTKYNNKITIKLVMPTACNCKCAFCYNKEYGVSNTNKSHFLNKFIKSINYLIHEIDGKNPITLDITGGEPTIDANLFKVVMSELRRHNIPSRVNYITLTTNGINLLKVASSMMDVVRYVNISTHHYDNIIRKDIFGLNPSSKDLDYKKMTNILSHVGITTSTTSVISHPIPDFHDFLMNYIKWCKDNGFIALRLRNDCFWQDSEFDTYMEETMSKDSVFKVISHENTPDSHWCRLRMDDGFRVFFLHGVEDTSCVTKGIEYVVNDDGMAYVDFKKSVKVEECEWEIGKIYDIKK